MSHFFTFPSITFFSDSWKPNWNFRLDVLAYESIFFAAKHLPRPCAMLGRVFRSHSFKNTHTRTHTHTHTHSIFLSHTLSHLRPSSSQWPIFFKQHVTRCTAYLCILICFLNFTFFFLTAAHQLVRHRAERRQRVWDPRCPEPNIFYIRT